jgi:hypothetical protein
LLVSAAKATNNQNTASATEPLTLRAKVRTAIHPVFTLYLVSTTLAGQASHAIRVQRNRKIAAFTVDVFVLLVKTGATLGYRLSQDVLNRRQ